MSLHQKCCRFTRVAPSSSPSSQAQCRVTRSRRIGRSESLRERRRC
jgi:hypothetical protein